MAHFELNPGERVFTDASRFAIQGKKIKFPVHCRCILTNERFVYFDLGKMAPFYLQLGFLLRLLVKGKPVSSPLHCLKISRGIYAMNKRLLSISAEDGYEILLENFDKTFEWFQNALLQNGSNLIQTGEEEWRISV
jgi:hypothetical protein